jgi:hypothetical protein
LLLQQQQQQSRSECEDSSSTQDADCDVAAASPTAIAPGSSSPANQQHSSSLPPDAAAAFQKARVCGLAADILADILALLRAGGARLPISYPPSYPLHPTLSITPSQLRTVALLDEVDLLLHSLKSELNFPVGPKDALQLSPVRWFLPLHLVGCLLQAGQSTFVVGQRSRPNRLSTIPLNSALPGPTSIDGALIHRVTQALVDGVSTYDVQRAPHLVLISEEWYRRRLAPAVADVALSWLLATQAVLRADFERFYGDSAALQRAFSTEHDVAASTNESIAESAGGDQGSFSEASVPEFRSQSPFKRVRRFGPEFDLSSTVPAPPIGRLISAARALLCSSSGPDGSPAWVRLAALLMSHLQPASIRLLNMTQRILGALPHCLSKTNRVNYGLLSLGADDASDRGGATGGGRRGGNMRSSSRRLLTAVPFLGKDVPSAASEFADPETLICLTALAFRHEGLRRADAHTLAATLKKRLLYEHGRFSERPSWLLFDRWLREAALASGDDNEPGMLSAQLPGHVPARAKRIGALQHSTSVAVDAAKRVLPLDLFQPDDSAHMDAFWAAIRHLRGAVEHFLCHHVFPEVTSTQPAKLSTSGHDLGSSLLLGIRAGFTGTPSELLPDEMGTVRYEPGSQRSVIRTLLSRAHVSVSVLSQWSVLRLLLYVAKSGAVQPPTSDTGDGGGGNLEAGGLFRALIDVGGLVTGLSNRAVCAALLSLGLSHVSGAVFIDEHNRPYVLARPDTGAASGTTPRQREDASDRALGLQHASGSVTRSPPETLPALQSSAMFQKLMKVKPVPLVRCGIPRERLFVFFDMVHACGTDIAMVSTCNGLLNSTRVVFICTFRVRTVHITSARITPSNRMHYFAGC